MIRIITGVPGAGKTYLAVTEILKLCDYDPFFDEYKPKLNTLIITNISDIKIQHKNFDEALSKMGYEAFFSEKNFELLRKKYERVLIVIDECQKYFHKDTWTTEVAYAFQYHRHLGIDIILMTQDQRVLPRGLSSLPEYIIRARSRSLNFGIRFVYDFYDSTAWTHLETRTLKKDASVFRSYTSYKFDENNKPKNVILRWVALTAVALLLLTFAAYRFVDSFFPSRAHSEDKVVASATPAPRVKDLIPEPPSNPPEPSALPTPGPSPALEAFYSYPVVGFVGEDGVLFADGRYSPLMTKDCNRNRVDFTLTCPFLLEFDGQPVHPSQIKRPQPSFVNRAVDEIKDLNPLKGAKQ